MKIAAPSARCATMALMEELAHFNALRLDGRHDDVTRQHPLEQGNALAEVGIDDLDAVGDGLGSDPPICEAASRSGSQSDTFAAYRSRFLQTILSVCSCLEALAESRRKV